MLHFYEFYDFHLNRHVSRLACYSFLKQKQPLVLFYKKLTVEIKILCLCHNIRPPSPSILHLSVLNFVKEGSEKQ